ncbi:hypothetical protein V1512DRAFT_267625 [Lipomyces arxii]|uniref:uncharacterized protein n=1 Tax=Lipomyces arxii TaxID=56418 RepID=UPI0034CDB1F3
MKFFSVISAIFVLALASLVAAAVEKRAEVTVTTLETIISCAPEITQCHPSKTSVYKPPVVTSSAVYLNTSSWATVYPNKTSTASIATFTGAANAISGPTYAVAAAVAGIFAFVL